MGRRSSPTRSQRRRISRVRRWKRTEPFRSRNPTCPNSRGPIRSIPCLESRATLGTCARARAAPRGDLQPRSRRAWCGWRWAATSAAACGYRRATAGSWGCDRAPGGCLAASACNRSIRYGVEGPMGRTVADVALMLDAQAVQSSHDPLSFPQPGPAFVDAVRNPRSPRRIAFSSDLGIAKVDPEVAEICRAAVLRFSTMEVIVEEASPDFSGAIDAFQTLRALLLATVHGELLKRERARIAPDIVWNIEKGLRLSIDEILAAKRARTALYHRVANFFDRYDILACPTVSVPPFPVEQRFPTEIGDEKLTTYIDWMSFTFV